MKDCVHNINSTYYSLQQVWASLSPSTTPLSLLPIYRFTLWLPKQRIYSRLLNVTQTCTTRQDCEWRMRSNIYHMTHTHTHTYTHTHHKSGSPHQVYIQIVYIFARLRWWISKRWQHLLVLQCRVVLWLIAFVNEGER